ncbi:hypothetical protein ACT4UL_18245, partial [Bacillus sp. HC-TM]
MFTGESFFTSQTKALRYYSPYTFTSNLIESGFCQNKIISKPWKTAGGSSPVYLDVLEYTGHYLLNFVRNDNGSGTGKSDMTSIMIMLFIIMYPGA